MKNPLLQLVLSLFILIFSSLSFANGAIGNIYTTPGNFPTQPQPPQQQSGGAIESEFTTSGNLPSPPQNQQPSGAVGNVFTTPGNFPTQQQN